MIRMIGVRFNKALDEFEVTIVTNGGNTLQVTWDTKEQVSQFLASFHRFLSNKPVARPLWVSP